MSTQETKMDLMDGYLSLQDRVYVVLRDWILSGQLKPNASLNTSQLAQQLNVSRTPVRDAVNRLVSNGLAVKAVHKEARVADFMSEEMYEIFKARSALEGIAASSAARYMSEEKKEEMVHLANQAEACAYTGDEAGFLKFDQSMHYLIYESLKTTVLQDMAKQLYMIARHNTISGYHIEGRREQVLREHTDLINAIERGDAEQAEKAGYQHLHNSITTMRETFETLKHGKKQ